MAVGPGRPGVRISRAGAVSLPTPRALAALAVLTAAAALAACSAGGVGARDEGPAGTGPAGRTLASPTPTTEPSAVPNRVDAVRLVRSDPGVAPAVKRALKRCRSNAYPVDVSYGHLTGGPRDDVVVNVMTCDAVGVGSYVYRLSEAASPGASATNRPGGPRGHQGGQGYQQGQGGPADQGGQGYENVFRNEETPVYAKIDRGELVVTQKVYEKGDQVAYPSSEDVITYHWSASQHRFTEQDRTHNDYSNAVGGGTPPTSEN